MTFLINLVQLLIFPGLLFCVVFGVLMAGIDRKLVARMQRRVGPPILQPWYDFVKCCAKETIIPVSYTHLVWCSLATCSTSSS